MVAITYFLKLGHNNHGLIFTVVTLGLLRAVETVGLLWAIEIVGLLRAVETMGLLWVGEQITVEQLTELSIVMRISRYDHVYRHHVRDK